MQHRSMLKGFIGPLGDDIPSLLAVILALSLFFSALTFSYTAYNDKVRNFNKLKGAIDITRIITQEGLITEDLATIHRKAKTTAMSYGVDFNMKYRDESGSSTGNCKDDWLKFNYLVSTASLTDINVIQLKILEVCVG